MRLILCAAILLSTSARAELLSYEETPSIAKATVRIDGKDYLFDTKLLRTKTPAPGGALLVDLAQSDDLSATAASRGMTVATIDLRRLPAAARAPALRDLLPRLRQTTGAKRVLARGAGEAGAALLDAGALFDGVLIHRAEPFAAPIDPRGPKVIETFGSEAYWRPGLAAIGAEAAEGANRRRFFIAGTAQSGEANCARPINPRAAAPALRALLAVLDDWTKGTKPPASRAPRVNETGLVSAKAIVWPKVPGLPAPPADPRPVPAIDVDGNETAGLRLPDQALPIGTFTGFATQKDKNGPPCLAGSAIPFASNRADREKTGDPRLSLGERYGSRTYFVGTMRVVADKLVKERLLLKEDADAYVAAAKQAPF
ncbi:MAG: hypothetical protein CTY15_00685 [Methylocystis sp.]|nr:MAG: hypothetical protein CTY15_00685 [Methylocystis sp.]